MKNQSYSFVVRVWLDGTLKDGREAVWRGSVEQVGSNCRAFFSDLDSLAQYIQKQVEQERASSPTEWKLTLEHLQDGIRKFWKRFFHRRY